MGAAAHFGLIIEAVSGRKKGERESEKKETKGQRGYSERV